MAIGDGDGGEDGDQLKCGDTGRDEDGGRYKIPNLTQQIITSKMAVNRMLTHTILIYLLGQEIADTVDPEEEEEEEEEEDEEFMLLLLLLIKAQPRYSMERLPVPKSVDW
ncbi:hypothetical protein BC937DRAFT_94356 [Endogone sp. FLAS-F59071]|nr:hypothetical protein BC937DRAFT_94356 [Endogone sp. FLAS-F59071]|eukprot:RUS14089.1 hypothetical protein BC937DRAFT_94356 [Endogone sp. FLAS-F59071]